MNKYHFYLYRLDLISLLIILSDTVGLKEFNNSVQFSVVFIFTPLTTPLYTHTPGNILRFDIFALCCTNINSVPFD